MKDVQGQNFTCPRSVILEARALKLDELCNTKGIGRFYFLNNSAKIQPIEPKFGRLVLRVIRFFSKKKLLNLVIGLLRYDSAKTTPGFYCAKISKLCIFGTSRTKMSKLTCPTLTARSRPKFNRFS